MGKRKKKNGGFHLPIPSLHFEVPERAKRMILSIVMFALALVLAFAFFGKAGAAGNFLLEGTQFSIGRAVFVLPLFFVFAGLVLWSMKKYSALLVFLGLGLLVVSTSGVLATFARGRREDVFAMGGWLGSVISLPAFTAFGFWVG